MSALQKIIASKRKILSTLRKGNLKPGDFMKKSYIIFAIIFFVLLAIGYFIFDSVFPKADKIKIPFEEEIISAFVSANSSERIKIESDDYKNLLLGIENSAPTRKMSVNDYPTAKLYYKVDIITSDRNYCFFIYDESAGMYIEFPYEGIYKPNPEAFDFIFKYFEE